jgi:hypothetical protein
LPLGKLDGRRERHVAEFLAYLARRQASPFRVPAVPFVTHPINVGIGRVYALDVFAGLTLQLGKLSKNPGVE